MNPTIGHALRLSFTFCSLGLGLGMLATQTAQAAAPGADPTRPPGFERATTAPGARTGRGLAAVAAAAPLAPIRPNLQSVQVSVHGRSSAMIDGRLVYLGDAVGETSVVVIDAQGISLRGPNYLQRVALIPGGGKTISVSPSDTNNTPPNTNANISVIQIGPHVAGPARAAAVAAKESR